MLSGTYPPRSQGELRHNVIIDDVTVNRKTVFCKHYESENLVIEKCTTTSNAIIASLLPAS
jgi:hypothetical protein